MNKNMKFQVNTDITDDGKIIQEVLLKERNDVVENIMRVVIDTREAQVREALISMGWKPPKGK
ncbi:MAG: hypothetical protein LLG40_14005 [Deltaproteobacteria bacterium]|nr:hypothetical protein [Deltaproteobacteria bacterium]